MKLNEIATRLSSKLEGPPDIEISGVAGLEEASATELTFLANARYYRKALSTKAAAVIVGLETDLPGKSVLRAENPYLTFARAVELFAHPMPANPGIHPTAVIARSARIGQRPSIGPYVVVDEGVVLGDDCVLKSFVVIYPGARIGNRFLAHSHAVVRENAEVGDGVILQNGHGCDIGEDTLLCGQAGLAGSCKVGREVVLAGQVGAAGHLTIGDRVIATAQSGIGADVEAGKVISGSPAMDNGRWLKCTAIYGKLPEIYSAFRKIRDYLGLGSAEPSIK